MSAGLPGVGLSGIFFIVSALVMVPLEIARTVRGESSPERWAAVTRNLAIALAMIAGVELAYTVMHVAIAHLGAAVHKSGLHTLPVIPVLATLGMIAILLLSAKAAQLLARMLKRVRG